MKKCKCGCGRIVKDGNRFIWGHSNYFKKGNKFGEANKGKHIIHSGSFKEGNSSWKGKRHSEKTKEKISESRKGEKHWNWQGGITSLNDLLRHNSKMKIWRELVFLRDNFTCQNPNCEFCKNKRGGIILHSHHIKPLSNFPELVFDVNNGITYCAEFHLKSGLHKNIKKEMGVVTWQHK